MAQSARPGVPEAAPDLTGLRGTYVHRPRRAAVVVYVLSAGVWVGLALADLSGGGDLGERTPHVVAASSYVLMLASLLGLPPKVVLEDAGIRLRLSFRWRALAWAEVAEVRPDGSNQYLRAWLVSGRSVRLLGLPIEAGVRLQTALAGRYLPRR